MIVDFINIKNINTINNNRSFGIIVSIISVFIIAFLNNGLLNDRYYLYIISLILFITSLKAPLIYKMPCFLWLALGYYLSKFVSPIILMIIFTILFVPVSVFFRLIGRDILNIYNKKHKDSYWIDRASQPHSIKNQF